MESINPKDLIAMDSFADANIRIDIAYARDDNTLFGERIYREDARVWLHKDLSDVVLGAAELLRDQGYRLVLFDGLRTVDAQARMLETQRVKDNPQWLEEPRLLSPPGAGAHPRGMAIDCTLETLNGEMLDMGTIFDDLSPLAHRKADVGGEAMRNREILTHAMEQSAESLGIPLLPLPQEWWDFRLPVEIYERFHPLKNADLPPETRMISR